MSIFEYLVRELWYQGKQCDGGGVHKASLYSGEETMWWISPKFLWNAKYTQWVTVKASAYVHTTVYEIFLFFSEILEKHHEMHNVNILSPWGNHWWRLSQMGAQNTAVEREAA